MVRKSELRAKVKEKILLIGDTGVGKTYTCVKIAGFVAGHGKKVVYIDTERGAGRELEALPDEVLENITYVDAPEWDAMQRAVFRNDSCFLKILDGISEVFVASKFWLEDRFIAKGKYQVGESEIEITDREVFTLPWQSYSKVYDFVRKTVHELVKQSPHILVTMHPFGDTETKRSLEADVFRKFDTILELRRTTKQTPPSIVYDAVLRKHRGRPFEAFYAMTNYIDKLKKLFARRMGVEVNDRD